MKNSNKMQQITVVQLPIIKHQLKEAGKEVSKRIADLDIEKQVVTVDSIKLFKALRSELNKELLGFESQRKVVKTSVNAPYIELEGVYKVEISEKYTTALDTLKDKIAFYENQLKSEKKEDVEVYFNELCIAEKIDFVKFDQIGININLSTTAKKFKETVYSFITKINDDLKLIATTEFQAETLVEYKSSLNVSSAIVDVKTRKENEATETARQKAVQTQSRIKYLLKLGMLFVEITTQYEFNENIFISKEDIEGLSKEDFTAKYSEFEVKIADLKNKELASQQMSLSQRNEVEKPIIEKIIPAPISAPTIEKKEELKTASFEVTAPMSKLRALGEYMKANNITYKNI